MLFAFAGLQMIGITSVASYKGDGGSIAESFYHAMGWFSFGMALLLGDLGLPGLEPVGTGSRAQTKGAAGM